MDHRELLKKYMNLVGEEEGITFVFRAREGSYGMTAEDIAELLKINSEVDNDEWRAAHPHVPDY